MSELHPDVAPQLTDLALDPHRPLLISDADEVLFDFMRAFVGFVEENGHYYDWKTFALTGNIRRPHDHSALSPAEVRDLINTFFAERTEAIPPVAGAAAALAALSRDGVQVLVLSNLPLAQRADRARALARHGMAYPIVANAGLKGPTVRALAGRTGAATAFVDDIGHHHESVAEHAEAVHRLHFSSHPRLRALQGHIPTAHHQAESWAELEAELRARLLG
ncbi:MAG: hypothetical protein KDC18_07035 [Alphaproteobacteria bacterium]|nr:hypothetical protein [Alphaproteobacteria bacterium]MCB9928793.1 hypothetical protein [Alphaproteobacteria bacterium]